MFKHKNVIHVDNGRISSSYSFCKYKGKCHLKYYFENGHALTIERVKNDDFLPGIISHLQVDHGPWTCSFMLLSVLMANDSDIHWVSYGGLHV